VRQKVDLSGRKGNSFVKLHPLEAIVKRYFGVTDNIEETGYVLSDGTFLDLSGRHIAEGSYERKGDRFVPKRRQPDYLANQRLIDHRQLPTKLFNAITLPAGSEGREGAEAMYAFLRKTGAIRLMPEAGFLVAKMPTVESVARVVREWRHAFGDRSLYVDVIYPEGVPGSHIINDVRASREFESPTVEDVMEFLESKFNGASMGAALGISFPLYRIEFTEDQWEEIDSVLDTGTHLIEKFHPEKADHLRMVEELKREMEGAREFSEDQWKGIYDLLEIKATLIDEGYYAPEDEEGEDQAWIDDLKDIMEVIKRRVGL
jgi:hypothetical protein